MARAQKTRTPGGFQGRIFKGSFWGDRAAFREITIECVTFLLIDW